MLGLCDYWDPLRVSTTSLKTLSKLNFIESMTLLLCSKESPSAASFTYSEEVGDPRAKATDRYVRSQAPC